MLKRCICFRPLSREHSYKGEEKQEGHGPGVWSGNGFSVLLVRGEKFTETAQQARKRPLLWWPVIPANKEWKSGHGAKDYNTLLIIIPGNCQRLMKPHSDPRQKVSRSGIIEDPALPYKPEDWKQRGPAFHTHLATLTWGLPSVFRILCLLQPLSPTHSNLLWCPPSDTACLLHQALQTSTITIEGWKAALSDLMVLPIILWPPQNSIVGSILRFC